MQLLLWASIYLFTSIVIACITVQSFSKDNLTTGHEQFKRGSVTVSEVKACTWRVDTNQLMSAELPLSKRMVIISHNHCTNCKTAFCAETDSTPEYETQVDDTSRQLWDTAQERRRLKTGM